jgi:hypothetical protein
VGGNGGSDVSESKLQYKARRDGGIVGRLYNGFIEHTNISSEEGSVGNEVK